MTDYENWKKTGVAKPIFTKEDNLKVIKRIVIREITSEENIAFLKENMQKHERVFIRSGEYIAGAFDGDVLVGVCSVVNTGGSNRAKATYVKKEYRRNGIGTMLLREVIIKGGKYNRCLSICTPCCRTPYIRLGYIEQNHYEKYDNYFMKGYRNYILYQPIFEE